MRDSRKQNGTRRRAFALLEVLLAVLFLGTAMGGIINIFLMSERRAMFSILQNRAAEALREHAELVLAEEYIQVQDGTTFEEVLLKPNDSAATNAFYSMTITYDVFEFPNGTAPQEPPFKIVNVRGVWTYNQQPRTNIIQTVVFP